MAALTALIRDLNKILRQFRGTTIPSRPDISAAIDDVKRLEKKLRKYCPKREPGEEPDEDEEVIEEVDILFEFIGHLPRDQADWFKSAESHENNGQIALFYGLIWQIKTLLEEDRPIKRGARKPTRGRK
jgi:hypothetical protein